MDRSGGDGGGGGVVPTYLLSFVASNGACPPLFSHYPSPSRTKPTKQCTPNLQVNIVHARRLLEHSDEIEARRIHAEIVGVTFLSISSTRSITDENKIIHIRRAISPTAMCNHCLFMDDKTLIISLSPPFL